MVTKHSSVGRYTYNSSVLAKILMVTKLQTLILPLKFRSVLAKILMVTKRGIKQGKII